MRIVHEIFAFFFLTFCSLLSIFPRKYFVCMNACFTMLCSPHQIPPKVCNSSDTVCFVFLQNSQFQLLIVFGVLIFQDMYTAHKERGI